MYLGGTIPAAVLVALWVILFVWLYHAAVDPELRFRGGNAKSIATIISDEYLLAIIYGRMIIAITLLFINVILLLLINGIYVWLVVHNGREISSTSLQIMLVTFKLVSFARGKDWLSKV